MKITIEDLIRREGREPGGGSYPPRWRLKFNPNTVHLAYPKEFSLENAMRACDSADAAIIKQLKERNPMLLNAKWRKR